MNPSSFVQTIVIQWVAQTPLLLAYLIGIVVALNQRPRHRVPAALTLGAVVLLGGIALARPAITLNMYHWRMDQNWTAQQFGYASAVVGMITNTVSAAGIGLLLTAVFYRRPTTPGNPTPGLPSPTITL